MAHVDEEKRGIIKTPPSPGLVQVEEGTSLVLRSAWGSSSYSRAVTDKERTQRVQNDRFDAPREERIYDGYIVKGEGWRWFLPGLVHDFVAVVSRVPRQEDVAPMPVNVANGQAVDFNIRFSTVVAEMNWRKFKLPLVDAKGDRIRKGGLLLEERYPALAQNVRQALRNRESFIIVVDPIDPFDKKQPFMTTEAAIIRAALRPENIWQEAGTTIASALNEAALELGVGSVEPLHVVEWLNAPYRAGRSETNRHELMEMVVLKANQSLHRFGIVIFDPRLEGITLPAALERALEQRQSAEQADKAADHLSSALGKILKRGGLEKLPDNPALGDRPAQAYVVAAAIEALNAQSGVPSSRAPFVQVGDVMSGNAVGGPGGGSSKGGSDKKSGGAGAPKKR